MFCQYIFHNVNALFNLLNIICALLGEMPIDKNVFSDLSKTCIKCRYSAIIP